MVYIIQLITQLPLRWIYKLFFGLESYGAENLKDVKSPVIFISNHLTLIDPWFALVSLPFGSQFLTVRPIGGSRFRPPLKWFYDLGVIPLLYWIFDVVVLPKEGTREEKIQPIINAIKKGDSVLIFPEGGRSKIGGVEEFRKGTAEIFLRTGAQIIPIGIKKITEPKNKIRVTFGKSFIPVSQTVDDITRELHEKVVELVR